MAGALPVLTVALVAWVLIGAAIGELVGMVLGNDEEGSSR